ncbi:monosaccharide-sensing protein 2 [Medicago truncatula]|uniref:Tonoplast monosaccharide transporter 2 n=1 Tax=Medicago truncatula TaxID=3880 RepID=G7JY12_MEDTR|nr:monosaccharide-sensing protein 2 [Medicago truncatula]AES97066.1 tonoplast monosaccharide transporter 2 [Medicago truncatula]
MMEVVIIAAAATLGNLLNGWESSTIAGAMTYIKQEFELEKNPTLEGLIVSVSFITATVVTMFSGTISDLVGRRPMLITSSVMYIIGGLVMLWARNVTVILLSRIIKGAAVALAVTFNPLYISEIAPPDIRGQLNTLPQFSCSVGMFLAYILVFIISLMPSPSWRVMLSVISIPSVVYFLLTVFYLPESPRWLVSKGRIVEAEKVLKRLRRVNDVSGELALLAEGLSPGGEDMSIEEYVVSPASEILVNKEDGKDYIKLYGANEEVTMVAQVNGQGSMLSRSMLSMHESMASRSILSQQGSISSQTASNFKDPIVNLFGSLHESTLIENSRLNSMLINNANSISSTGDLESSPFGTSDSLRAPLNPFHGNADRAYGSKDMLSMRSNSSLVHGNDVEIPRNTDIGGGWKLVYKSTDDAMGGKREGLQRVYMHVDPSAAAVSQSPHISVVSTSGNDIDMAMDSGEAFQAAGIVSRSALSMSEVVAKGPKWRTLLEPGVKRALIVGIGLQILQQAAGINGFLFYAPQILEQAGVGSLLSNLGISSISASFLVNIITSFCMLPCIAISVRLMDVAGRRSIMLYTIPILIICLLVLVLRQFFQLNPVLDASISAISVVVYESVFCMGLAIIPAIICSEIFPTSVRGICISLTSLTNWTCMLVVTLTFPYLLQLLSLGGVFSLFVGGCISSWIFVYLKVPETKGMPLEIITEFFAIGAKPGTDPAEFGMED